MSSRNKKSKGQASGQIIGQSNGRGKRRTIRGSEETLIPSAVSPIIENLEPRMLLDGSGLSLQLPQEVTENDGVLQNQGQVVIDQPLGNDLLLNLSSNNTNILQVPSSVMIPAGQTTATFDITLINDWQDNGDANVTVSAVDATGLVTDQTDVWVYDVQPPMDQYLIHPSVYNVGNYWNYDVFYTEVDGRDVTQYNVHGSLSEKVTRNVVFNGQAAFELAQNASALGRKVSNTATRCLADGFVQLLQDKGKTETDIYTNPQELYWLGIPNGSSGTVGDGGVYDNHTETRTYTTSQDWQQVTVPAGTFNCYVITISEKETAPGETTEYTTEKIYFNPYIGIVKNEIYWHEGAGNSDSYRITQTLKKTNVRLPGDLTAEVLAPVNASNLVSGDVVRVPVRVTNVGTQAASGNMNIEVYVKDSQQILHTDTPAVVLKSVKVNLKPGQSATYYANVQLPLGVEGELYCIAKIDPANTIVETDESNNTAALGNSLSVALGYTDLVGQLGKVSLPGAVVAGQRVKGTVQVQVRNVGNVKLGSQARVNIAVYATNTLTGEQILLGQLNNRSLAKLAANGAKATFTVAVNLPAGVAKGEYEIEALITPVSGVGETNLTNNRATGLLGGPAVGLTAADPFIDLVAGVNDKLAANAKYALPANVVSGVGKVLYVPITITNAGNISTARSQRIDVNLYAQNAAGEQFLLGIFTKQNVGSLAPGKTKSFTYKTTLPAGLAAGEYTIVADIDASDVVAESDETNNAATLTRKMNVQEGFVDLTPTITKVTAPNPAQPGQRVVVVAQVVNQGNILCNGKANLKLEAVGDDGATTLYTLNNQAISLTPGKGKTFTLSAVLPNTLQNGQYSLRLTVDPATSINEGGVFGATNNTAILTDGLNFVNPDSINNDEWIQRVDIVGTVVYEATAADGNGNVYIASSTGVDYVSRKAFLRKYNSSGMLLWSKAISGAVLDIAVSVDAANNVYISGTKNNSGNRDVFLQKYNETGKTLWAKSIGTAKSDSCKTLAVDSAGNAYIAGYTDGNLFGANAGLRDPFVAKYDSSGRLVWGTQPGTECHEWANDISIDAAGNVYTRGQYISTEGDILVSLSKFDSTGQHQWTKQCLYGEATSRAMVADQAGNLYVIGEDKSKACLAMYDTSGTLQRKVKLPSGLKEACSIALGTDGIIYVTGTFYGFDVETIVSLMAYDSNGYELWPKEVDTSSLYAKGYSIALDHYGNAFIAGQQWDEISDGDISIQVNQKAFIAKLNVKDMVIDDTEPQEPQLAPDLTVHIGDPADGKPATTGWARIDVKNEGDALANGFVDIELWCTSDGVIDGSAGDYLLKTITNQSLLLLPGETQYVWANYQLPEGVNPAGVELIAIVDTGNAIPEVNEDNNFGDFNLDGVIDIGDLNLLVAQWGATGNPSSVTSQKEWIQQITSTTNGIGQAVVADSSNNVYFSALENVDTNPQAVLRKYDSLGNLLWTQMQTGISASGDLDNSLPLAVDSSGNVFWGGMFDSTATGIAGAFVFKYAPDGTLLWERNLDTPDLDDSRSLAVDSNGNVYLAGYTEGSLFDENQGKSDAFLAKFDTDGNLVWGRQFGISYAEFGTAVTVDGQDNVYLAGSVYGNLLGEGNVQDLFLTKYDSNGDMLWTRQKDILDWDECSDIDTDDVGNVYLVGGTYSGGFTGFLTKYDSDGLHQWTQTGCGRYAASVEVGSGPIYVGGYVNYKLGDFQAGGYDFFISKRSTSNGDEIDSRQLGTTQNDFGMSMAMDSEGFLYLGGYTEGLLGDSASEGCNPFLAKLDADMELDPQLVIRVADTSSFARTGTARIDFLNNGAAIGVGRIDFELWCTTDGVIDGKGDYLLQTFADEQFIHAPGVTRSIWVDYELPSGVNPGAVKLVAHRDIELQVPGSQSNYYGSGCVYIMGVDYCYWQSDLTTCIVDPLGGIPEQAGQALLAVKNIRSEIANETNVLLELWCTSDGVIDGNENDYLLNSRTLPISLGPKETEYYQMAYELPAGVDPADVELIAHVDEDGYYWGTDLAGMGGVIFPSFGCEENNFGGALVQPSFYGELLPAGLAKFADYSLLRSN